MQVYKGSGSTAPFILISVIDGDERPANAPATLPPGKNPQYPVSRNLDGPQSLSESLRYEMNSLPLSRFESPNVQPVTW